MMNQFLKNLNKIEFVVTYACTGRCKHCSEGDHTSCGERIDPGIAADAVRKIAAEYDIKTVMTFGGEPLLYTDAVYEIMTAAKELNIPKRQVITNGYFSKNAEKIFAAEAKKCGIPIRLQPAWLTAWYMGGCKTVQPKTYQKPQTQNNENAVQPSSTTPTQSSFIPDAYPGISTAASEDDDDLPF